MTSDNRLREIVVVGGGTAGWMVAAALARMLGTQLYSIKLVESEEIGTIGVGEATIPAIREFNRLLGLDENAFVRATQATFKLGIEFIDWGRLGSEYIHAFGPYGIDTNGISFLHYWLRAVQSGKTLDRDAFSTGAAAARRGKFMRAAPRRQGAAPHYAYAFQFDAALYAAFLRKLSEARGVERVEGRIVTVDQHAENGFIRSLTLADGREISGDFFIDCSGFRGLLIEQKLGAGFEDWSHWLPCDRAWAVPSPRLARISPLTRVTALEAGWTWRIPLQHRTGNGHVFASEFTSEQEALDRLIGGLEGAPLAEPRLLKFTAGKRKRAWINNCFAVGLAGGFLEPLESTSIHLIQSAIYKLLAAFPQRDFSPALVDRVNAQMDRAYERIRDFIIAHYKVTERADTPFWRHCAQMPVPDSLAERLERFAARGEVLTDTEELFREPSWFAILHGQGLMPVGHHPIADSLSADNLAGHLARVRAAVRERVDAMPDHEAFIAAHCAAPVPA